MYKKEYKPTKINPALQKDIDAVVRNLNRVFAPQEEKKELMAVLAATKNWWYAKVRKVIQNKLNSGYLKSIGDSEPFNKMWGEGTSFVHSDEILVREFVSKYSKMTNREASKESKKIMTAGFLEYPCISAGTIMVGQEVINVTLGDIMRFDDHGTIWINNKEIKS